MNVSQWVRVDNRRKAVSESRMRAADTDALFRHCDKLGIPRGVASDVYSVVSKKGLTRGRRQERIFAAVTYGAAKMSGVPVTLQDVKNEYGIPKDAVYGTVGKLFIALPQYDAEICVRYGAKKLGNDSVTEWALQNLNDIGDDASAPMRAAIALYRACNVNGNMGIEEVAKATGVKAYHLKRQVNGGENA